MILKEIATRLSPLDLYRRLSGGASHSFLLQSADGPRKLARFSMLGRDPHAVVSLKDGRVAIAGEGAGTGSEQTLAAAIRVLLARHRPEHAEFRYLGGLVGYIGYEYAAAIEKVPRHDGTGFPDAELGLYLDGVVYDHAENRVFYFSHGTDRSQAILQAASRPAPDASERPVVESFTRAPDQRTFEKNVEKAIHYIREGDIFQAVLSKRFEGRLRGDLLDVYAALLQRNPSPYMYCLKFGGSASQGSASASERAVVGASPEMLVRVQGGVAETFPIAGTRAMTSDPKENERLGGELLADAKERAEHAMLVDLARNDLGRVCEFSSIDVPERMRLERYSHVQHLVSRVTGRLRRDMDGLDALHAVFPAGTVSGAPKVRAMEIIHELEGQARGPYAGAVGYFSFNGAVDSAITLRSLFADRDRVSIGAGAGIVADSVASREWEETEEKARVLTSILGGDRREPA